MYDSDSDASQLKMPKARQDFHGNLGLNFDLCRESMALESGNTGLNAILSEVTELQFFCDSVDSCFLPPDVMVSGLAGYIFPFSQIHQM